MDEKELTAALEKELGIDIPANASLEKIIAFLEEKVNVLLQNDFHGLITMLYRIDINEKKLKQLLADNREQDAASIITALIIKRQEEKAESRNRFRQHNEDINENDKW